MFELYTITSGVHCKDRAACFTITLNSILPGKGANSKITFKMWGKLVKVVSSTYLYWLNLYCTCKYWKLYRFCGVMATIAEC